MTGGNDRIRSGITRGLLGCGGAATIRARNADKIAEMVEIRGKIGPAIDVHRVDNTDWTPCRDLVQETVCRRGRRDILVNNAGAARPESAGRHAARELARVIDRARSRQTPEESWRISRQRR